MSDKGTEVDGAGLTKREAFAMAALPQCIDVAMDFMMAQDTGDGPINEVMMSEVMQRAAQFSRYAADALLAELASAEG